MADRSYQLVVFGATGFTGRLVCEHIARDYQVNLIDELRLSTTSRERHDVVQGKIRWAMAGRSREKLDSVRHDLQTFWDGSKDVTLLIADVADAASLDRMAKEAQVVLNMVGPYSRYGSPVVKACVNNQTHYCDITGEVPWVKRMIERYHDVASRSSTKVVHCCGFDCVPFDIGTFFVVDVIRTQLNRWCSRVEAVLGDGLGGVSGGTIESLFHVLVEESREMKRVAADPHYLNPPDNRSGPDRPQVTRARYQHQLHQWTGPSIMASGNGAVVRRSAALLHGMYGDQGQPEDFSYKEAQGMPGPVTAAVYTLAVVSGQLALALTPRFVLPWLRSWFPSPGEGPSREARERGHFRLKLVAHVAAGRDAPDLPPVVAEMGDNRDPGYWSTSRMALECALCLVLDEEDLRAEGLQRGGVLTPAAAMGSVLIQRLLRAGYTFRVISPPELRQQAGGPATARPGKRQEAGERAAAVPPVKAAGAKEWKGVSTVEAPTTSPAGQEPRGGTIEGMPTAGAEEAEQKGSTSAPFTAGTEGATGNEGIPKEGMGADMGRPGEGGAKTATQEAAASPARGPPQDWEMVGAASPVKPPPPTES